ncbi:MAG: hypothetical protein V4671_13850 [Armatimonadota bacterium]
MLTTKTKTAGPDVRPSRRSTLAAIGLLLLGSVLGTAGCSSRPPAVSLTDLTEITVDSLTNLVLGPPDMPTRTALTDPPLLKKGEKESVIIAADIAAFAAVSRGAIPEKALTSARKDVVRLLDRRLKDQGFSATESTVFPPAKPADNNTLVATLVPVLESAGSPEEKAAGRGRQLVLIRLSVTDPLTGEMLRQRDYYSGRDVKR